VSLRNFFAELKQGNVWESRDRLRDLELLVMQIGNIA
jgi:hypothetical protein